MTRKERINQEAAAFAVAEKGKHQWFNIGSLAKGFAEGAAWADEHPKEKLWDKDKVIEWLEDNLYDYIYINRFAGNVADWNTDLIKNLITTMEE